MAVRVVVSVVVSGSSPVAPLASAGESTADEVFDQNPGFAPGWSTPRLPYVLATRNDDRLTCPDGRRETADVLATPAGVDGAGRIDASAWERRSLGCGFHGERVCGWTAIALDPTGLPDGGGPWLPVRQQTTPAEGKTTVERDYYRIGAVPHRDAAGATSRPACRDSTNWIMTIPSFGRLSPGALRPPTRGTTMARYGGMSLAVGAGKREWRAA